jgi:hypothetical protein
MQTALFINIWCLERLLEKHLSMFLEQKLLLYLASQ